MSITDAKRADSRYEFDPFSSEMLEDPYDTYRLLRREAPVTFNHTRGFWAVMTYDNTREVLKNSRVFSNTDGVELDGTGVEYFGHTNVGILDPPDHKKIRSVLAPSFTPGAVRPLEQRIADVADQLVDQMVQNGEADFATDYAWKLPADMISALLGIAPDDREWVADRVIKAFTREPGSDGIGEDALEAATEVRAFFATEAAARRANPHADLLSIIIAADNVEGKPMTDEDVGGICLHQFAAGIIPTGLFITNSLLLLLDDGETRQRLIDDPELLPKAVEELWRVESPVQNLARTALEDYELDGHQIMAGDRVAVFPGSANRDESIWGEDSETVDIDRDFKRNVVLGDGVHVCLGSHLARIEGRIGLGALLKRIPEYKLSGPIERSDRVLERGLISMPVTF